MQIHLILTHQDSWCCPYCYVCCSHLQSFFDFGCSEEQSPLKYQWRHLNWQCLQDFVPLKMMKHPTCFRSRHLFLILLINHYCSEHLMNCFAHLRLISPWPIVYSVSEHSALLDTSKGFRLMSNQGAPNFLGFIENSSRMGQTESVSFQPTAMHMKQNMQPKLHIFES